MLLPHFIQFETNTVCNQHCVFCPHDQMKPREQANNELISKIIRECAPTATNMCPFLMQDPLLEPRLREILMEIKRTNWRTETTIYTSMHNANMIELKKIVDDGTLDYMMISLYGHKYQPGLKEDSTKKKLNELIRYRNSTCRRKPIITMQWISGLEGKELVDAYNGIANGIQIVPYDTFHGAITTQKNRQRGPNTSRAPCARLWNSLNIHSNGNVVPCCIDFNEEIVLGNAKNTPLIEIWNSDKFNELREMHMQKRFDEIPLCKNCIVWEWL